MRLFLALAVIALIISCAAPQKPLKRQDTGARMSSDVQAHPERYGFNPRPIKGPHGPEGSETDCSAMFTDVETEMALMPVYFFSDRGACREQDAWARLSVTTRPHEYDGAKLVTMNTPLSLWIKERGGGLYVDGIDGKIQLPPEQRETPPR